jgi:hypothetical protein
VKKYHTGSLGRFHNFIVAIPFHIPVHKKHIPKLMHLVLRLFFLHQTRTTQGAFLVVNGEPTNPRNKQGLANVPF